MFYITTKRDSSLYRFRITNAQARRIAYRLVAQTGIARNVWTRGSRSFISMEAKPREYDHVEISLVQ